MKPKALLMKEGARVLLAGLALLAAAGCASTPTSRIASNREEFSEWPAEVQDKVIVGKIDVGFTPQQVRMALGAPEVVSTRTTEDGVSEVWSYGSRTPRTHFDIGLGTLLGNTGMGVGVGTSTGRYQGATKRVVFDGGKVSSIDEVTKQP